MQSILIVDDDQDIRNILWNVLKDKGFAPVLAQNGKEALGKLREEPPDLVLLDMRLPDMHGLELLEKIRKQYTDIPVIIITAYGEIPQAVRAMKLGAYDYLAKPISNSKIVITVKNALESAGLKQEIKVLKHQLKKVEVRPGVHGKSKIISEVFSHARKVAETNLTVVIEGETGTGKEVFAHFIHKHSNRKDEQFVKIDLGAIPETLIESELFGYEKGAFTSAQGSKMGLIEVANHGTLFIDEVGNSPLSVQAKLLRVLEEHILTHLGGTKSIPVDVRFIAATALSLQDKVNKNEFREDLYHRLNQFTLYLPPLRERKDDIPLFLEFFLKEANEEMGKAVKGFAADVLDHLINYSWPGNIRELKNIVKRAVLLADNSIIRLELLPKHVAGASLPAREGLSAHTTDTSSQPSGSLSDAVSSVEKKLLEDAMKQFNNNKAKVARYLGIDRKSLYNKLKKYSLSF